MIEMVIVDHKTFVPVYRCDVCSNIIYKNGVARWIMRAGSQKVFFTHKDCVPQEDVNSAHDLERFTRWLIDMSGMKHKEAEEWTLPK